MVKNWWCRKGWSWVLSSWVGRERMGSMPKCRNWLVNRSTIVICTTNRESRVHACVEWWVDNCIGGWWVNICGGGRLWKHFYYWKWQDLVCVVNGWGREALQKVKKKNSGIRRLDEIKCCYLSSAPLMLSLLCSDGTLPQMKYVSLACN